MSAQNLFLQSTTERSPTSRFREHAKAFIYRNRWVALYQGFAGAIGVVVSCLGFGFLYLLRKRNLWSNIICHGLNDTLAFMAGFLGAVR